MKIIIALLSIFLMTVNCSDNIDHKLESKNGKSDSNHVNCFEDILFTASEIIVFDKIDFLSDDSFIYKLLDDLEMPSYEELERPFDEEFVNKSINSFKEHYDRTKFYQIDISNDGLLDIIYTSNYGAEEWHTIIWINTKDKYKFVKMIWGIPRRLIRFSKEELYSIVLESGWCCASQIGDITLYEPQIENNELIYTKKSNYRIFEDLVVPSSRMPPLQFETINDKYRLRLAPEINDSIDQLKSEFESREVRGNILAEFKKGTRGVALSQLKKKERTWYFVVMDIESGTTYNRFYDDRNSHKIGWMSSRYLKIID